MENERNKEFIVNWGMEHGLHAIMAQIEREMCINFAQLYLRNG